MVDASIRHDPPRPPFQRGMELGLSTYPHLSLIGRNQSFGSRLSPSQSHWSFDIETTFQEFLRSVGIMGPLRNWCSMIAGWEDLLRFARSKVYALTDGKKSLPMS